MTVSTPMRTVETFRLRLDNFAEMLAAASPVAAIEQQLLDALDSPQRLLRWAIVQVEDNCCHCEGAYLKLT